MTLARFQNPAWLDWFEYITTSVGMAIACSGFAMMGQLFGYATGPGLLIAVVAGGALCLGISLPIAELASMYPSAPGVRTYFKAAFGDHVSLALTFIVLGVVVLIAGVESFAFYKVLHEVIPSVSPLGGITLAIGAVAALNLVGVELPRKSQVLMTAVMVLLIIVVASAALGQPGAVPSAPDGSTVGGVLAAGGGAVFLYTGFEWVTPLGRRPASYQRQIPWSMPIALVILGVSFVMLTLAIGHQLPAATVRTAVIPQVMLGQRVGHWGWMAMIVVSLTATLTTFNAGLMGSSRLIYGIARERRFFSWAARLSDRTGNPTAAILAFAGTCWCVAVVEWRTNLILEASVVAAVLYAWIYAGFVVANVRLRRLKPGAARSFRTRMPVALQGLIAAAMALFGLALLIDAEGHRAVVVLGVVAALGGSGLGASLFIRRGAPPPRFAAEASPSERGSLQ